MSAAASRSRTRSFSPAREEDGRFACRDRLRRTVTMSPGLAFSSVTIAVISFVMLAIGHAPVRVALVEDLAGAPVRDEHRPGLRPAEARKPSRRRSRGAPATRTSEKASDVLAHDHQAILGVMDEEQKETKPDRIRGVERSLQVEVRGTRRLRASADARLRLGRARSASDASGSSRWAAHPAASRSRAVRVSGRPARSSCRTLGNPIMTIALAGVHAARALRRRATS